MRDGTTAEIDRARTAQLGAAPDGTAVLPGLEAIARRLATGLGAAIRDMGTPAVVAHEPHHILPFEDWKHGLAHDQALARFQLPPLKGGALLTIPLDLLATLIDRFYGGNGGNESAIDGFGASEQRFFARLAAQFGQAMATAWAPLLPIRPSLIECGPTNVDFVFGQSGDKIVVQDFFVTGTGLPLAHIQIVLPLSAVRALAVLQRSSPMEVDSVDPSWRARLQAAVLETRLPLRTVIARPTLSVQRLMTLAPGDVIPVCLPARVPVTASGRLFAHGSIGQANGRAAIRIERIEHGADHD